MFQITNLPNMIVNCLARTIAPSFSFVSLLLMHPLSSQADCPAYPPPPGTDTLFHVASAAELAAAVGAAGEGSTILISPGNYLLEGTLYINRPHITLRSSSGNRDDVVLDGNYREGSIVQITSHHAAVVDLSIRRAFYHAIHITGGGHRATLYNLRILDARQQFVKANPSDGDYTDYGTLACSDLELTDAGRAYIQANPTPGYECYTGGLDAHQSRDWVVRDNSFRNIYCTNGSLAEHCVHFWRTSRDPLVERNRVINCARGIGFGLGSEGGHRVYPDDPTVGTGVVAGHIGGTIRNNFIFADIGSEYDSGIGLEQAWGVTVEHNSIYSTTGGFNVAIDLRFEYSNPVLRNNLYYPGLSTRNDAAPTEVNNLLASSTMFVDLAAGDLHLRSDASGAVDQGASSGATDDIDGDSRDTRPDIGADELSSTPEPEPTIPAPTNLRFSRPSLTAIKTKDLKRTAN